MQVAIADTERFERGDGFEHVVAIGAGYCRDLAARDAVADQASDARHIADGRDRPRSRRHRTLRSGLPASRYRAHGFKIDRGHLFARAQIGESVAARRFEPPPDRQCRGRRRRDQGQARGPAARACRGERRKRRRASGAARPRAPARARQSQSPAATSVSHSQIPRGLRRRDRNSSPWRIWSRQAARVTGWMNGRNHWTRG